MEQSNQITEQEAATASNTEPKENNITKQNSESPINSLSDLIESEFDAFRQSYPNVSKEALVNDQCFLAFMEGKESGSLSQLYNKYEKMVAKIEENAIIREQTRQANAISAVGALKGEENSSNSFFTKEQVLKMSPQEIKQNYTKIRESQANW